MGWNKYAHAAGCKRELYEEYKKLMRSGHGKEVLSRAIMIALQKTLDPHDAYFNHDMNEDMALMHLFLNQYGYKEWRDENDRIR